VTSIYQQAMGKDFERLHPKMQERFGFASDDGIAQLGSGTMDDVWRGPWWTLPFLLLGSTRRVLFPGRGRAIPFDVANYAYRDTFERETVTWARRFKMRRQLRAFDATMIYSTERGCVVDYLGTHQHLAVDLHCAADDDGAMRIRSGAMRFYEGAIGFTFPASLCGTAEVREWWDDEQARYGIDVRVTNPRFGPLFGYRGSFNVRSIPYEPRDVPLDVKPLREEARE
jgi:hypothetical protein